MNVKWKPDAYLASDEYKQKQACAKAKKEKQARDLKAVLRGAPKSFTKADKGFWASMVEKNVDSYGSAVLRFADRWARLVDGELKRGKRFNRVVETCSHIADTEEISGFMYGAARSTLIKCWVHGKKLQSWKKKNESY
jgi:hypothetical protein